MQIHKSETNAGRHDLLGAVEDGGLDVLALLQMPVDVLDRHRRLVDEDADGERQPAQGHDVERLAERPQRGDRAEHRQRYGRGNDQGRAKAAEKEQDHQAGQCRGDDALAGHAADRGLNEERLIRDLSDLKVAGQDSLQLRQFFLDAIDNRERRCSAIFQHHHQD